MIKRVENITGTFENHSDETAPPNRNILEGWHIFILKGGIHSSVWSIKTFPYNIRELRNRQHNKGVSDFEKE